MTNIDAIRTRNNQEHPRFLQTYPVGSPEWEWLRAAMDRRDLLAELDRLTAERDELAATVQRVQALADAMGRDHAKDDASSGGWFFATEAAIEGLRDALRGESDG